MRYNNISKKRGDLYMLINKELSEDIYNTAGNIRRKKAKEYIDKGKVNIIKADYQDSNNFSIKSIVYGNYGDYKVDIDVQDGELQIASCECQDYLNFYSSCKHIIATLMKFEQTKFWENSENNNSNLIVASKNTRDIFKYKSFNNLINSFVLLVFNSKLSKIVEKMGGLVKGKGGELSQIQRNPKQFMEKLGGMFPQNLLNQMGGTGGIMNMIKEFESVEGLKKLNGLKRKIKK